MQYLLLIYAAEEANPKEGTKEFDDMMNGYFAFSSKLQESGKMLGGEALHDVKMATTVSVRNGETTITDGPFAETKEQLGGFYMVEADDLDEALKMAAEIPTAAYGRVEVRPVIKFDV